MTLDTCESLSIEEDLAARASTKRGNTGEAEMRPGQAAFLLPEITECYQSEQTCGVFVPELTTTKFTDPIFWGVGFGFSVVEITVAVSVNLPTGQEVFTVKVNCADAPLPRLEAVHVTVPDVIKAGTVQLHPAGAANDRNSVVEGTCSVKVKLAASIGPWLSTVATKVSSFPLPTIPGLAATVVTKFAPGSSSGFTMPV
jgi:hypothetical protein